MVISGNVPIVDLIDMPLYNTLNDVIMFFLFFAMTNIKKESAMKIEIQMLAKMLCSCKLV